MEGAFETIAAQESDSAVAASLAVRHGKRERLAWGVAIVSVAFGIALAVFPNRARTDPAAVKTKGSIFQLVYRRLVPRLGHAQAIGAIAHRLCRLIWRILHERVRYQERGPEVSWARIQRRAAKMIRELRSLGYRVESPVHQGTV